jgi:TPR repeat protein
MNNDHLSSPQRVWGEAHCFQRRWAVVKATLIAFVSCAGLVSGASAPSSWWWASDADAAWTNRSLEEVRGAAGSGDKVAQYYLGRACFVGQGQPRDPNLALSWTRRSAEQGYPQAQFAVGRFYYAGVAVERNYPEGFRWVAQAAGQGHPDAMGVLGRAYEFGEGTPRNSTNALEWLQRAVNAGSRFAPRWLGEYYLRGEARTARRTNYVEALRWFERAAADGSGPAAVKVADMYCKGQGTPPDFPRALQWARRAVDGGDPSAMDMLAGWYSSGLAEPRTARDNPIWLFRRAAVIRAVEAREAGAESWAMVPSIALMADCRALWNRYRFGLGTPRDNLAAAEWMWVAYQEDRRRVAAGQGSLSHAKEGAPNPLEYIIRGDLPPDDLLKGRLPQTAEERCWQGAVQLVHEALDLVQPAAWYRIGECYRDGSMFSPKDHLLAWGWFARAKDLGHLPADEALKRLESKLSSDELTQARLLWVPPVDRKP